MTEDHKNQTISYRVKVSRRARRMRISVGCEAGVVVILPWGLKESAAKEFVRQKQGWILKSLNYFERFKGKVFIKSGWREYYKYKQRALDLAKAKTAQWNKIYNFGYGRVSVKNQKTRWGSCSKKGNLNFNYKIVHLPEKLVDYLTVHELCHLKEMNHSGNFWNLVGQTVPNYRQLRRELKNFGVSLS
jgi:predicted metal-dependent hydrolase